MSLYEQQRAVLVVQPSVQLYGADRMLLESVAALGEAGWRVVVVVPGDGDLVPLLRATGAAVRVVESPVVRKAYLSATGIVRYAVELVAALPRTLSAIADADADVVYVNTVTVPLWSLAARVRGLPVVCHVHEAEADAHRVVRTALAAPLLLAQRILVNSRTSRDVVLADLPVLRERMQVVYNGFDGPPVDVAPRAELTAPVRLVLVGRLSARKGTDVAIEAVSRLVSSGRDVVLELVGGVFPGYEWFEAQVHARSLELGLADRVSFRGELPDQWGVLQAADIALVPSRVEPFGNTAVEAMLAQRPLVASGVQGLTEIVDPGRTGLLAVAGDADSLAAQVRTVIDDWPAALQHAATARGEAVVRFSRQRYRDEVVAAVAAVAAGRRRRRSRS